MTIEAEVRERQKFKDVTLLALKIEEGAINQGIQVASRIGKKARK